jgi:hypothetical protein
MQSIGKTLWSIPGGRIPLISSGHEPEFTSRDQLAILNAGDRDATITLTIFYADTDPVGPYSLTVPARRLRKTRFNDLIDPLAMPLDTDFGAVIESDVPVVVQFTRLDSRAEANAITGGIAFAHEAVP